MENTVEKVMPELSDEELEVLQLAKTLRELAPHFPQAERLKWAVKEQKSIVTVQRYVGANNLSWVKNVTLAKALIADMEAYKEKSKAKMVA
jgi:hypothetical protein